MEIDYQDLGLTTYESKAYKALIKFGRTTATKISKESTVPYSRIYDVLESLSQKGIIRIVPGITKEYIPSDPKVLLEIAEKKKGNIIGTIEEIKSLKKIYELGAKETIIVSYGKKNFYTVLSELKKTEKYEYAIKYNSEPKARWLSWNKQARRRGLDIRDMAKYDEETKNNVQKWLKQKGEMWRKIENEGVAMAIKDDEEIMISLIKSNVTMLIRDKPFVKLMKQFYLALWEKSPEIKKES